MVGVSCAQKCDHYMSYWAFGNPTEKEKHCVSERVFECEGDHVSEIATRETVPVAVAERSHQMPLFSRQRMAAPDTEQAGMRSPG